ncbi:hypothetical protein [Klebsiella pneumoniae]|uniref:hypothetical protein n=1 Tax=Klebsiella pneumoniae TaxID=573 RepID=UPI0021AFE972|nr:hypothetical protein [Klebsiella pneumoniae]
MANDNNQLALIITEQDKSSGEVIHLVPNSKQSIQPKSLLRLGVFVPTVKDGSDPMARGHVIDATTELCRLSSIAGEGYEKISIFGPRLDMDTDFKVWLGIVDTLANTFLEPDGTVRVNFIDFAFSCGLARGLGSNGTENQRKKNIHTFHRIALKSSGTETYASKMPL